MFEQTGSSANLTYWRDGGMWIEVLTSGLRRVNGEWKAVAVPTHHVRVYRDGIGQVGEFSFKAKKLTGRGLALRVRDNMAAARV